MSKKQEKEVNQPTPEQLLKWMENDLAAAISFLHIIKNNPQIMAMIQVELLESVRIKQTEK